MDIIEVDKIESDEEKFAPEKLIRQDEVEVVLLPFAPGQ